MKFQPFGERVAIKVLKYDEVTDSGLVVSVDTGRSNRGEVVALGDEVKDYLKVGDTVIFTSGTSLNYGDISNEYKVLSVRDIVGKLVETDENE